MDIASTSQQHVDMELKGTEGASLKVEVQAGIDHQQAELYNVTIIVCYESGK